MTTQEKLRLLEDMLEMDENSLTPEDVLTDIDAYDSMAKLSLIVLMEEEFNVKLTGNQIRAFTTVDDILKVMQG